MTTLSPSPHISGFPYRRRRGARPIIEPPRTSALRRSRVLICAATTAAMRSRYLYALHAQRRNAPSFGPQQTHSGCRVRCSLCSDPRATGPAAPRESNENCQQWAGKPRKFSACCSRHLCPTEQKEFIKCIRTTRDASACHEFRDEVERCGVKTSQRMLRAALSDDWF